MERTLFGIAVVVALGLLSGCSSSSPVAANAGAGDSAAVVESSTATTGSAESGTEAEVAQGDSSVSAEDGGPGFTGEGWVTPKEEPAGDPRAQKGGTISSPIYDWPENLRLYGTTANTYLNSIIGEMLVYESLVELNENTLEFMPGLASHWWMSDDQMVFRFRINPAARWADGQPVVAADVIATWKLLMDDTLQDPMSKDMASKFAEPVAKSKYIVEITCKERDWRNFISFSGMRILPAHEIGSITGKDYLDKYNFTFVTGSGPYMVRPEDIKDNESITITRRNDYWAKNAPRNQGRYNFDKMRWVVIRDHRLAFDKTCKGELDFEAIYTAAWWVVDVPKVEAYQKGQLIRQRVYTKYPEGIQGLAFNMRRPPLDDVRVRKALALLWNRREALEKFAYNEYSPLATYYPGEAANPDNEMVEYDPRAAVELLKEAGWTEKGPDGILVKDGNRLSFVLSYSQQGLEKYYTSYKESCKQVGVEINLELLTHETLWKNIVEDRKFQMCSMAWSQVLFPSPKQIFHSSMADASGSNNLTGLKDAEIDRLIEEYDKEFDIHRRTELLRELDGKVFATHHYALAWYLPSQRLLYWRKFGMPEFVLPKYTDWRAVFAYWWVDPQQAAALKAAQKSGEAILPLPDAEVRHWLGEPNVPGSVN